jgi:protein MpaA
MDHRLAKLLMACTLLGTIAFSGCGEQARAPGIIEARPALGGTGVAQSHIAGLSVQNRLIECVVLGEGADVTLIMATIHGSEPAGTALVRRLAEVLAEQPDMLADRKVVLVPVANPDGMAAHSRYNARNVDLNRNFATYNRRKNAKSGSKALSEPETRTIEAIIREYSPDRIVSIHQPLACIDYDGPAQELARRMAEQCDLPVKKLGAQPGSLGSYAGLSLGVPIVTFELPRHAERLDRQLLWRKYGPALIAAVTYQASAK